MTSTDNLILLHGPGPVAEAARYLAEFGVSRVAVCPGRPDPGPYAQADHPVMLGELAADGRLALTGVAGRYGTGNLHGEPGSFVARDGLRLPYHHHACGADTVAIVLHGASAHGDRYAVLAAWLRERGLAETYAPTLRGHYAAGRNGDLDNRGQLLEDLEDLVAHVRRQAPGKRIILLAHSVSGGLALTYAARTAELAGLVLFAPYVGASTRCRSGERSWARVHRARFFALTLLDRLGLHAFEHLPVVTFDPPLAVRDGTETLSYSYRLARAFDPAGTPRCPTLVLAGGADEVFEPRPDAHVIPRASHLGVVFHPDAHAAIARWWP